MRISTSRRRRRRGFTLMEVLLVMAILVIIGSLVTVSFIGIQKSSQKKGAQTQIHLIEQALDVYQVEMGHYPQDLAELRTPPTEASLQKKWTDGGGPYLKKEVPPDPWGRPYKYQLETPESYRVWSTGPDGVDGGGDDIDNK